MGFQVRAVKIGYFRAENPSKGFERKYPGDVFEVEENEFSDAHRPEVRGKVNHQGWMEKVSDWPTPSFGLAPAETKPQTLSQAAQVPVSSAAEMPKIDGRTREGRAMRGKNKMDDLPAHRMRTADETLKG